MATRLSSSVGASFQLARSQADKLKICPRMYIPVVLLLILGNLSPAAEPLSKVELSKRGKEATALLELQPRTSYAAAFCVHASGLFVTAEQPLRLRGNVDTVVLVLRSGLKTQKAFKAKVVRRDAELNLALLRIDGVDGLPALPLGADDDLAELLELVAFGFPSGPDLAEGEYPALTVKLGHVASLQRKTGDLIRVQLDTGLSAGYAGGAVLDPQGKVAGVVMATGSAETTAIVPAGRLTRFLNRPEVQFTPPAVTSASRGQPHLFEVRAESILPAAKSLDVELILRGEDGKERRHKLAMDNGVYRVKAVPVPETPGPVQMQATITFPDGSVSGAVGDQRFSVAGTSIELSAVQSVRFGPKSRVVFHDGKLLDGPLTGLGALQILIDGKFIGFNLSEAIEARFSSPSPQAVVYTVIVTREGQEVARLTSKLGEVASASVPATGVIGIRPPVLSQDQVVKMLPGPITDVCVGGGGRFLILHLAQQRKLAIFDVNEAQVIKYLPVAEDNIKFAAGLDKLFIALPAAHVIQRWSLATLEREVSAPVPFTGKVGALAMGSASRGPLLVGMATNIGNMVPPRDAGLHFLNIDTIKAVDYQLEGTFCFGFGDNLNVRASADGHVFSLSRWHSAVFGVPTLIVTGQKIRAQYLHHGASYVIPSPDGRVLFTDAGLLSNEGKAFGSTRPAGPYLAYPAHHGTFYVQIQPGPLQSAFTVYLQNDNRPLITIPSLQLGSGNNNEELRSNFPFDKRVHLIPEAKLILTIPAAKDRLVLHRFDLDDALAKAGIDYLFVASQPPAQFRPGAAWSYQPAVKSKKGGVKYKLESGPPGMELSASGLLRWVVPANFDQVEIDVVMTVSDASGQEIFHSFKLTSADGSLPPTIASAPVSPQRPAPPADGVKQDVPTPPPIVPPADVRKEISMVRAPANPQSIKPSPLKGDKMILPLPATARDICVGGGGRFLIFHLPQPRQLAVFDVNEARIVKYLPLAEDNVFVAAGMDKLVVLLPGKSLIQRWSLATFEREARVPLAVTGQITTAIMGSASDGPLVLGGSGLQGVGGLPLRFFDVLSLREIAVASRQGGGHVGTHPQSPPVLRISADGRVLGMWCVGVSPSGFQTAVLSGNGVQTYYEHNSVGNIIPGPDGRVIFTNTGLYNVELKRLDGHSPTGGGVHPVPAVHGNYYLSVTNVGGKSAAAFHMIGDFRPLVTLSDLDGLDGPGGPQQGPLPLEKRLFLIPRGGLIVTVPPAQDKLHLYRFDLDQAMEKAGIDYLLVTSEPRTAAVKGQTYEYSLAVKSKKGSVKHKLESGPDGMKIGTDGRLTWKVPQAFADKDVDVIIAISDASGQEIVHTFKIAVKD